MKKGQISSLFKYIFGFVAGALFLIFFVTFGYNYLGFAGSLGSTELVVFLDDSLSTLSVSSAVEDTLDVGQTLDFQIYEGMISSNSRSKSTNKIIYSAFALEGKKIGVASRELSVPYSVGNLFYLDDGTTLYVVVYDSMTSELLDDLNLFSFMNLIEMDTNDFDINAVKAVESGFDKVRFIFLTKNNYKTQISSIKNYDVLEVSSPVEGYGTISYEDGDVIYLGNEMLLGGILCENAVAYEFNLDLVFEKMNVVTGVYYDKAKFLSTRLPNCGYTPIKTALNNYKSYVGNVDSASSYASKVENLDDLNKVLGGDCPEIY